jgi:DNA-binding NtrC family response regulator
MNNDRPPSAVAAQAERDNSWSKKTVLLVDVNSHTRESRSRIMRTLGVTVHCAASLRGARSKLESGVYNLVLVDLGADTAGAEALVQEIRLKKPRQLVAFLVGSPLFVATSLNGKRGRLSRVLQPLSPSPVPKPKSPAKRFDFGQKIKDAEAEEVA